MAKPRPAVAQAVKAQPRIAVGKAKVAPKPIKGGQQGVGVKGQPGAAPAAPAATPTPWDPAYETSVAGANRTYGNALAGLAYQKQAAQQEYGLDQGFNDYQTNPYSRAALLEQKFKQANRGTSTSYAARGQLYAGSSQNALSYNREGYGQERDSLEKTYRSALQGIGAEGLSAGDERNERIADATWERINQAAGAPLDPSTSPAKKKSKPRPAVREAVGKAKIAAKPKKGKR